MHDLRALVSPLLQLCYEAGELICQHYHAPGDSGLSSKADDSPLTHADLDSHVHLRDGLAQLTPGLPLLSEESSPATKAQRRTWPRFWLVDPLDGTKEFVAGTGEFTINIALVEDHRPVLGVLYVPLQKLAYVGIPGDFAARFSTSDGLAWERQTLAALPLSADDDSGGLTVLASRRHRNHQLDACLAWLEARRGPLQRENSGSALKFCRLAEGRGDVYPRFSPCCEWDVAAGQALLEAVGGSVLGLDGEPLRYNCRDTLLSPHFLAVADAGSPLWQELLANQRQFAPPAGSA
ncbi:3'(2'),5'-bisphosphate nucleotidase CysQ [Haliea sp. E1-2-M8]|uniref:3'(2'),5'-bisphosphate nucleotidase CysQ n=1 Tax=Haliea sp. E1-2-M8 TaxID=3064706 RepID=UPI0027224E24|nr:3'(2'),5'-bisphosphate nucleotidase CysQ [Haliea sp. E1-2-M8]MDO8863372.1 3'(2'),5'-bisphosphate nucleotidase CysQ [Haliea sp. E1-2-M8]